jgi:pyrroline-5-carboxylate reductase
LHSKHWKPSQITVCDIRHDQLASLQLRYKIKASVDSRWAAREAHIILLAVKPQQVAHVLKEIGPVVRSAHLVLSIAAGIRTAYIESFLAKGVPVVRIMPNTPALVRAGASAIAAGRFAQLPHLKTVESIFSTVGTVVRIAEKDIDAVTALSGSGPAYLFYLAEAMHEAGTKLGLTPHVANGLVRQTLKGASLLLAQSHEEARTLRQRVTSPGGTTEAAISVFEKSRVKASIAKAIRRAQQRARELAQAY